MIAAVILHLSPSTCLLSLSASSNDGSSTTTDRSSVNADVPNEQSIEELEMNNVFWTPAQLNQMSSETFLATVEILGNIPDYSEDQLHVLSVKAAEVQWRH